MVEGRGIAVASDFSDIGLCWSGKDYRGNMEKQFGLYEVVASESAQQRLFRITLTLRLSGTDPKRTSTYIYSDPEILISRISLGIVYYKWITKNINQSVTS